MQFLVLSNIIHEHQFAYSPQLSTTDQLVLLTHQMACLLDKREVFDIVFLDFAKAFDKVHHHPTLLRILSCYIDRSAVAWFRKLP